MAEEFDEEEVWATIMEKDDSPKTTRKQKDISFLSNPASMTVLAEQSRQSSPVNIPKWSKIREGSASLKVGGRNSDCDDEDDEDEKFPVFATPDFFVLCLRGRGEDSQGEGPAQGEGRSADKDRISGVAKMPMSSINKL